MDWNTVGLIVLGVLNLATAAVTLLAKRDIRRVEIATNSMKDALVASTAKASHAEGREEMRIEQGRKIDS